MLRQRKASRNRMFELYAHAEGKVPWSAARKSKGDREGSG